MGALCWSLGAALPLLKSNSGWSELHVFTLDQLKNLAAMQGRAKDGVFVKGKELQSRSWQHLEHLVVISCIMQPL